MEQSEDMELEQCKCREPNQGESKDPKQSSSRDPEPNNGSATSHRESARRAYEHSEISESKQSKIISPEQSKSRDIMKSTVYGELEQNEFTVLKKREVQGNMTKEQSIINKAKDNGKFTMNKENSRCVKDTEGDLKVAQCNSEEVNTSDSWWSEDNKDRYENGSSKEHSILSNNTAAASTRVKQIASENENYSENDDPRIPSDKTNIYTRISNEKVLDLFHTIHEDFSIVKEQMQGNVTENRNEKLHEIICKRLKLPLGSNLRGTFNKCSFRIDRVEDTEAQLLENLCELHNLTVAFVLETHESFKELRGIKATEQLRKVICKKIDLAESKIDLYSLRGKVQRKYLLLKKYKMYKTEGKMEELMKSVFYLPFRKKDMIKDLQQNTDTFNLEFLQNRDAELTNGLVADVFEAVKGDLKEVRKLLCNRFGKVQSVKAKTLYKCILTVVNRAEKLKAANEGRKYQCFQNVAFLEINNSMTSVSKRTTEIRNGKQKLESRTSTKYDESEINLQPSTTADNLRIKQEVIDNPESENTGISNVESPFCGGNYYENEEKPSLLLEIYESQSDSENEFSMFKDGSRKRRAYDNAFKLRVIEFAERISNCAAERQFGVTEKLVRDWRKSKNVILRRPKTCKRNIAKLSQIEKLEEDLLSWFLHYQLKGSAICSNAVRLKAKALAADPKYEIDTSLFSFGNSWCSRFVKTHGLSFRGKRNNVNKTCSGKESEIVSLDNDSGCFKADSDGGVKLEKCTESVSDCVQTVMYGVDCKQTEYTLEPGLPRVHRASPENEIGQLSKSVSSNRHLTSSDSGYSNTTRDLLVNQSENRDTNTDLVGNQSEVSKANRDLASNQLEESDRTIDLSDNSDTLLDLPGSQSDTTVDLPGSQSDNFLTLDTPLSPSNSEPSISNPSENIRSQNRKHCTYDNALKYHVIQFVESTSRLEAEYEFDVPGKLIDEWLQTKDVIIEEYEKQKGHIRVGALELEKDLVTWFLKLQTSDMYISNKMVCLKALELANEAKYNVRTSFKASNGWFLRFMKRHELTLRRKQDCIPIQSEKMRRHSYDNAFKSNVIGFAESSSNELAVKVYNVSEKLVRYWRKSRDVILNGPREQRRHVERTIPFEELERDLITWCSNVQQGGFLISRTAIMTKARELCNAGGYSVDMSQFKASNGWCTRFLNRNGLLQAQSDGRARNVKRQKCYETKTECD